MWSHHVFPIIIIIMSAALPLILVELILLSVPEKLSIATLEELTAGFTLRLVYCHLLGNMCIKKYGISLREATMAI